MYVFEYKCLILGECWCCESQSFSVREKLRSDPDQSDGLIKLHAWLYIKAKIAQQVVHLPSHGTQL